MNKLKAILIGIVHGLLGVRYASGGVVGSPPNDGAHLSIVPGCVCGRGYIDWQRMNTRA